MQERIAPGLRYSQLYYEDALDGLIPLECDWLDAGCGRRLLPEWRVAAEAALVKRARRFVGVDAHEPSLRENRTGALRVLAFIDRLPFPDASFHVVTANMVVEHLAQPQLYWQEIHRVLAPGGCFVFHTPNRNGYITRLARAIPGRLKKRMIRVLEGRAPADVFPTHYRANTAEAIHRLAAAANFEVESIRYTLSQAQFARIPPLAFFELLWIRLLMHPRCERLRHTMIVVLRKPQPVVVPARPVVNAQIAVTIAAVRERQAKGDEIPGLPVG